MNYGRHEFSAAPIKEQQQHTINKDASNAQADLGFIKYIHSTLQSIINNAAFI